MVQRRRDGHAGEATAAIIPHMVRGSPDPDALVRLIGFYRTETRHHLEEIERLLVLSRIQGTKSPP